MRTHMHVLLSQVRGPLREKFLFCHCLGPRDETHPHLAGPVGILLIRVIELGIPTLSGLGS